MPFGLANTPAVFQHFIQHCLRELLALWPRTPGNCQGFWAMESLAHGYQGTGLCLLGSFQSLPFHNRK
jgi:hypothetical protein